MDKEYTYNNGKYNMAVSNIKSSLFDILSNENLKTSSLENMINTEEDNDKKTQLKEQLKNQKSVVNKLINDVDIIIEDIEKLDSLNIELSNIKAVGANDVIKNIEDKNVSDAFQSDIEAISTEKSNLENEINDKIDEISDDVSLSEDKKQELDENVNEISEEVEEDEPELKLDIDSDVSSVDVDEEKENNDQVEDNSDEEKENDDQVEEDNKEENNEDIDINIPIIQDESSTEQEESEISNKDLDDAIDAVDNQLQQAQEINDKIASVPEEEKTAEMLAFIKTTKSITKAILVKQTQLKNLKDSREKQKELVNALGLFEDYDYLKNTKNALTSSLESSKDLDIDIDVNLDKERQIEDLMVKANIYTNEGETEKAQAIYDKIRELNGGEDADLDKEKETVKVKA